MKIEIFPIGPKKESHANYQILMQATIHLNFFFF